MGARVTGEGEASGGEGRGGGGAGRREALAVLEGELTACRACRRLVAWREEVAGARRAAFRDEEYWGRPVPGFGDPDARVCLVGLAPAAHTPPARSLE